jgi:uncharacterized protein (DUF1800 family)
MVRVVTAPSRRRLLTLATGAAVPAALLADPSHAAKPKGKNGGRGKKGGKKGSKGGKSKDRSAAATRHALSRFTYGWTPALAKEVDRAGGFDSWFTRQVTGAYPDNFHDASVSWWPSLSMAPEVLWARHNSEVESMWEFDANYQRWVLLRRINSRRQVLETMTEFWENHLHVPARGEGSSLFRADYGKVIRARALGRFSDLLVAAITHPAMGVHLDNAVSKKAAPNENLGRELLELFTVGVGNYTEADVKDSARILTGYRVDIWKTWRSWYEPLDHATGPVTVAGFTDPNANPDGQDVTRRYLEHLARHPATAKTIARKLAIRFVSDTPSQRLVDVLAKAYLDADTAIVPVLRTLLKDPEFARSAGEKVRTPADDVVATYRVLGVQVRRPRDDESTANAILWQTGDLGTYPHAWPRPDGLPDNAAAWSSTSRWLASLKTHYAMAGGWWPKAEARYRPYKAWVPVKGAGRKNGPKTIRFDDLVDHMALTIHGKPANKRLLKAACAATGCKPRTLIDRKHPVTQWVMPHLLTTFLDSPEHMTR